jgi:predicted DNA-binding transcriptional regulator AlpA
MGDAYIPKIHHHDKLATVLARHIEGDDDVVVRTPAAAGMLGMSIPWMEAGRSYGYGPKFIHIGPRAIGYRLGDLRKYLASRSTHQCTSEYRPRRRR